MSAPESASSLRSWWAWWVRVSEPFHFLGWLAVGLVVGRLL